MKKRSWHYRFMARLEFYRDHGTDPAMLDYVSRILSGDLSIEENDLIKLANKLTPPLNYVINIEYQTMRRHSKSYDLVPFKDYRHKGETKRIYDYLDNRKIITDYLTDKVFRLTKYDPDIEKSRREMCPFWAALRRTRCMDMKMTPDTVKLVRIYNRRLSSAAMQKRFVNAAVTLGLYIRGSNADSPIQDCFEALLRMNDNDIHSARRYKTKKLRQLNADELAEVFETDQIHRFSFVDEDSGVLYDYDNLFLRHSQAGGAPDDD